MDRMINNIWLVDKLVCTLKTYRTCNSIVCFSKYEFNNKLLSSVTLLKVIWTQPFVCVCVCVWERERERERENLNLWSSLYDDCSLSLAKDTNWFFM